MMDWFVMIFALLFLAAFLALSYAASPTFFIIIMWISAIFWLLSRAKRRR
jgi:hypothetical protein